MMTNPSSLVEALRQKAIKSHDRRVFLRKTAGVGAGMAAGMILGACHDSMKSAAADGTAPSDDDILNFALNLEYLEANFYHYAVFGTGIDASLSTGAGNQGAISPGHQVMFTDPVVAAYAKEIAMDELDHVTFLRTTLGRVAVAQPMIDVSFGAMSAFSAAAQAAGRVPAGTAFDPYANDENFLLGAFIFEDVGVTAYKGASPLITNKTYLEAAAGILAAEAYHAGLVRTVLYSKGIAEPALYSATNAISDARDSVDGTTDDDQGIQGTSADISNIVPLDANGLAYSRSAANVLNIVYLNAKAVTQGSFFPTGVNGSIMMSAAN